MRITTNILALLLCLAVLTASVGFTADNETDRLKQDVEYLCSPGLAGRDVPSIEGDMTAIWLAEQFYSIGLLPAMNGTSYLQEVPLEVGWLDTVATTLTIRGSDWEIECRWRQDFYVIPRDLSGASIP